MKKSNPVQVTSKQGVTSAMSLIAITAGAVSAALVIMFVGFFMTVVSIGSSAQVSMHAVANSRAVMTETVSSKAARAGKQARQAEKGHFMDALLREDMHRPAAAAADGHAQPAAKATRIFANPLSMPFVPATSRVINV